NQISVPARSSSGRDARWISSATIVGRRTRFCDRRYQHFEPRPSGSGNGHTAPLRSRLGGTRLSQNCSPLTRVDVPQEAQEDQARGSRGSTRLNPFSSIIRPNSGKGIKGIKGSRQGPIERRLIGPPANDDEPVQV